VNCTVEKERLMSKSAMIKLSAAGFVLVGLFASVAGAQLFRNLQRPRFINTGLFSVAPDEHVNFHVALDDVQSGPPARVLLRLFDHSGAVIARDQVSLRPGEATTVRIQGPGRYRAQVQVLDGPSSFCDRRTVISSVEAVRVSSSSSTAAEGTDALFARGGGVRFILSADDGRGPCFPD